MSFRETALPALAPPTELPVSPLGRPLTIAGDFPRFPPPAGPRPQLVRGVHAVRPRGPQPVPDPRVVGRHFVHFS